MAVADRLRELRAAGKHELVVTLASEMLRKEEPWVTVTDGAVEVKTRTFVGEHPISGPFDPTRRATVESALTRRGTYRLRDPDEELEGFTFTSGCHYDAVVDELSEAPAADAPPEMVVGAPGEPDPSEDESSPSVDTSRRRDSSSFLKQAVTAVQNQFRE